MKKFFILTIFISSAYVCCAQIIDNFSDGDYTANPAWAPNDPNNWTVVGGLLRSNSAIASSSFFITTPSAKALNVQWEFFIQLQFNTSSANYVDVYLVSEQANLSSASNNGYFVRIGGTPDEISLYKMTAGVVSQLINGTDGVTNSSNNSLRIKVIRDANNTWSLERIASGGATYYLEGTASDNSFSISNFFGMRVQQSTSSFFNRHFFDDIYVGDIIVETDPPMLNTVEVTSGNQLLLLFNEPLNPASAQNIFNYSVSNSIGNPLSAVLQGDEKSVLLTFQTLFTNGFTNTIDISGVEDAVGNVIAPVNRSFLFFIPSTVYAKDIIITEILADPSPQVGLPDAEYIEIYNRSSNPIDVNGWKFSDGNSTATLPSTIILPDQYWVICSTGNAALFSSSANTMGVSNFPTINNGGEPLTLKTNEGFKVDSVNFTLTWYRDDDKQEGGWSLELIDTNNPCGEEDNWIASEDDRGGTPGKTNSVNANKPDLTGPKLLSISMDVPNQLLLQFDEKLEASLKTDIFTIAPQVDIAAASFASPSLREIKLVLLQDLTPRQLFTIEVNSLRDCSGNFIQENFKRLDFALPETAESGDVLINEILFNPRPGGVDFVEVVNVSPKYLNLKDWLLANYESESFTNLRVITKSNYLLAPQSFLIFTTDGIILKNHYPNTMENSLLATTLPSLPDDKGSLAILANEELPLDYFEYEDDFHSRLVKDKEGVSLERISLAELTRNPGNWKSANASVGYATPGFINSNSRPENALDENVVIIEPEIFSPAVPGQDFARINYRFDQSALAANIKIVDHQGSVIKEIANNATLGFEGFFRWDGDREDGGKARMGYYFVWFEVFDLNGMVKTYRKRVVIGR